MDTRDVTTEENIAATIRLAKESAERAVRRAGEIPKDHIPPFMQIQMHVMQGLSYIDRCDKPDRIITTQIPAPYTPCTLPIADLKPILISEMKLETHHRGRRTVVRVLASPNRLNAVMAPVEDEGGTAALLQVYHQPEEVVVPTAETLRQGCFYMLKDPYLKTANSERVYSLRVDHVGDIVELGDTDELVPAKWRRSKTITGTSESIRAQGNAAVGQKRWAEAERLYTNAIEAAKTSGDEQLAYLNRSLVNLRLGRPAKALSDAVKSQAILGGSPSEKALFREAGALYQLTKFEQCLKRLESLTTTYPSGTSSQEAKAMLRRVKARLHEQQTGEYNFGQMCKQAEATPPIIDCATYSAPVEVRPSPGRGRGLFTTRKVAAGELLLCEKAFGYAFVDKNHPDGISILMNVVTKKAVAGSQATLLARLVQKLYHDPEAARLFSDLHHGDYQAVTVAEVDGKPVVDSFAVERTMTLNCFGAPRTTRLSDKVRPGSIPESEREQESAWHTTGVWCMASYINHSCMRNCHRSFIGDMQIIRATRDMEKDTELLFAYVSPLGTDSYQEVQKRLKPWEFVCGCGICSELKATSRTAIAKRNSLREQFKRAVGAEPKKTNIPRTLQLLEQLEATYAAATATASSGVAAVPRLAVCEPYLALSQAFTVGNKRVDAIEMVVQGLEALGFAIIACPRRSKKKAREESCLKVERWGRVAEICIHAFVHLSQAFDGLAPEQSREAIAYAKVAYRMCIGEDVTFFDTYPELK